MTRESSDPVTADGIGTLTPERFAKVRAIFEVALEQPARDRLAFVKGACVGDAALLREVEAMLAADATGDPLLDRPASTPSSSAPEEGRFPAGTVLAGRYRILGRLGQGGMGEVYRAHDLILNQTVALKFLAPSNLSEAALARFRNEVRIARQVSHPNVCRVYDLGMVEGLHFLSMEYIDGEDLASLLRRIGRLPQDKAIEFTRKICAGLGAAHERGVLHRDLKPANIMIDGRGQPRITDFGLAGLAAEIPLSDLRSGTPAYMSPEQKAGKDVTVRSDLYSLGLVLHEMFTGKARKDTQSSPSEIVKDLDPAIERLILRCLEDDSKRRPSSALNVAMALPGADPIAAALAAGETPSPEMVAASHEKEGLSSRAAVICFIAVVLATAVISVFAPNNHLLSTARLDIPPDGLANHAQGVLRQLGYTDQPASTAYGFDCCDRASLAYANGHARQTRDAILASHRPPVLRFWYRQHQDVIYQEPTSFILRQPGITFDAPPNTEPGMVRALFDPLGRLLALEARPFRNRMDAEGSSAPAFDWSRLFSAAGLDPASFVTRTPQQLPPMPFDAHMSWAGVYGPARSDQVHVEAAAWQGRPVYFLITGADAQPTSTSGLSVSMGATGVIAWAGLFAFLFICVGAGLLARHNLRAGRGDRKGAARVAAVYMACAICAWILTTSHVARPSELGLLLSEIGRAGVIAGLLWLGYIAVEPFMRRHWPESLISWNRLHSGHIRDPLLASHVLTGIAVWSVLYSCVPLIFRFVPVRPPERLSTLDSPSDFGAYLAMLPSQMLSGMVALLVMVVALRVLARRRVWIADILASLLFALTPGTLVDFSTPLTFAMTYTYVSFMTYAIIWLIRRFGFVAMLFAWMGRILIYPVVFGTWFTGQSLIPLLIPVVIAGWALWVIVSDQRRLSTESNA